MDENKYTIKCNNCNWRGLEDDLTEFYDSSGGGYGCPKCKTDHYLMDINQEDYDG